jgi:hypothetical protein
VLALSPVDNSLNIVLRVGNTLSTDNTFKYLVSLSLSRVIDNSRTINEVNSLSEGDVLPALSFSGDGSNFTNRLLLKGVNHR